jgi:hypothetical protein
LEPASFRPRAGEAVAIEVMVGEAFRGEVVPRRPARIAGFWVGDGERREPVRGVDGASPAGLVSLAAAAQGWQTVLYESRPAEIELSPERFADHLRLEGHGELAERLGAGRDGEPIREIYSRCSAALLLVGEASDEPPARPATCPIELWPVDSPRRPGATRLSLTREGRAIVGGLVRAYRRGHPGPPVEGRTDAFGRLNLPLDAGGVWLLKALQIEPVDGQPGVWRSWWATLTLELVGD